MGTCHRLSQEEEWEVSVLHRYRKLNKVTKKDAHPLPRVEDLLDALQVSQIFSTLDLRSGCWQRTEKKLHLSLQMDYCDFSDYPLASLVGLLATFQRPIEIVFYQV